MRVDYTADEVRRFARRAKDAAQARRLLAIAAVLDGASREEAAKIGGMTINADWVIRFNEQGPDGLINVPSPGAPGKLNDEHKTFLFRCGRTENCRGLKAPGSSNVRLSASGWPLAHGRRPPPPIAAIPWLR